MSNSTLPSIKVPLLNGKDAVYIKEWDFTNSMLSIELSNDKLFDFDLSNSIYPTNVYRDNALFFIALNHSDDIEIQLDIDGSTFKKYPIKIDVDHDGLFLEFDDSITKINNTSNINGKNGNILNSVSKNDNVLIFRTTENDYSFPIKNYNGVVSNNIQDVLIDEYLNFKIITDDKTYRIDELSVFAETGDIVTSVEEENGNIKVYYYSKEPELIGHIENFNPPDTNFPISMEFNFAMDKIVLYLENDIEIYTDTIDRFNGNDAVSIKEWYSETELKMTDDRIIDISINRNDVIQPNKLNDIDQSSSTFVMSVSDIGNINISDMKPIGVNASTIMTMLGDGESLYYEIGNDFSETITGISGDDFSYGIVSISLEGSSLKQTTITGEEIFDNFSRKIVNFELDEGYLIVHKNYGLFDSNIGYVLGKDFDDGIWVTKFEMVDNDLFAYLSDDTSIQVNGYDRVEIDDIVLDSEKNDLTISFKNGDVITLPEIKGNDAIRSLVEPYVSIDNNGKVVYHFDDGDVITTGRIKGSPAIRDVEDMSVTNDYFIGIDFDDNTHILSEKSFKWNFGFDSFENGKEYYTNDTVISDSNVFISKSNNNNTHPEESPVNWQKIPTIDQTVSVINYPNVLYPINDAVLKPSDPFIIETSGIRSYFNGVSLFQRELQIKKQGNDWDNLVSHFFYNSNKATIVELDANQTYEFRIRDYASESIKSNWTPIQTFTIEELSSTFLILLENNSWTPKIEIFTGNMNEIKSLSFIFDNNSETEKRVEYVTDYNEETFIPFGLIRPNTPYKVNASIETKNGFYISNNTEFFNTGTTLQHCISPEIEISNIHYNRVNVLNSKYNFYNDYFSKFKNLYLIWEIKNNETNEISTIRTRAYIDYYDLDNSYGNDINIKCRLNINNEFTPWSETVNVLLPHSELKTNINYSFSNNNSFLNIELSGNSFTNDDVFIYEIEYKSFENHTIKKSVEGPNAKIDILSYLGKTIEVKARALLYSGEYSNWSELMSIHVPNIESFISEPKIIDFFTVESRYIKAGNIITQPDIVEFEVTSDNPDFNSDKETYTFNTDSPRLSFPVKHYLFDEGTIHYYRSRIFDNDLGWSGWSETKQFGYMLFTEEGEHELIVPEQVSNISFVVIGAGGGGCYTVASHTATGGALRYISNLDVVNNRKYKLKVGESAGFHTSGGDSYVDGVISAGGGAWYGTSVATGASSIDIRGQCLITYGGGDGGNSPGDRQSGGAGGYVMSERTFEEEGDSGASGTVDTSAKGGGTGILGSVISSNTYNGSQPYPEVPVAGGGGGIGTTDNVDFSQSGAIGVLFGDISYPSGMLIGWNK